VNVLINVPWLMKRDIEEMPVEKCPETDVQHDVQRNIINFDGHVPNIQRPDGLRWHSYLSES